MSYKIYQGELITFYLKESDIAIAKSLTEVEIDFDDKGLLLMNKETKEPIGHVCHFVGIDEEDFFNFFNKN